MELINKENFLIDKSILIDSLLKCYIKLNPQIGQKANYNTENNGLITKYTGTLWGFVYFLYSNETRDLILYESVTLLKYDNIQIMEPYKKNEYFELKCAPKEDLLILYKIKNHNNGSHSCSMSYLSQLISHFNDKDLEDLTLKNGVKTKKNLSKDNNDVFFYNFKFKGGNAFLYQNKSNKKYKEQMTFTIIENMKIYINNSPILKNSIDIDLDPGKNFLIKILIENPFIKKSGFNFKTS